MAIRELPRHHVKDLGFSEFDSKYFNRLPVILSGASICPAGVTLHNVGQACEGKIPVAVAKTNFPPDDQDWAGLDQENNETKMTVVDFVASAGQVDGPPRAMFDMNIFAKCPSLVLNVTIPAHVSTSLLSQWKGDWEECSVAPHFTIILSEKGFESRMHIDSSNTAFVASMCTGRKRWRIVTSEDITKHADPSLLDGGGVPVGNKSVFAQLLQPYASWGESSLPGLGASDVFEGILEPGEMLYIPPGAHHAGQAVDHSLMVTMNDQSLESAVEARQACLKAVDEEVIARCLELDLAADIEAAENMEEYGSKVPRVDKSFLEAYRCTLQEYCVQIAGPDGLPDYESTWCQMQGYGRMASYELEKENDDKRERAKRMRERTHERIARLMTGKHEEEDDGEEPEDEHNEDDEDDDDEEDEDEDDEDDEDAEDEDPRGVKYSNDAIDDEKQEEL